VVGGEQCKAVKEETTTWNQKKNRCLIGSVKDEGQPFYDWYSVLVKQSVCKISTTRFSALLFLFLFFVLIKKALVIVV
jgi:hypothetical protein